jgi:MerR family transcriptional regulator, copper efflux regulator
MDTRHSTSTDKGARTLGSAFGEARRSRAGARPAEDDADIARRASARRQGQAISGEAARSARGGSLTIGEAAARSGVSAKMIRYYESIGLLRPPLRTSGNYRIYEDEALRRLRFIGRARELGFSIREIDHLLGLWLDPRHKSAEVKAVALRHVEELAERIAVLQRLKGALEHLAQRCHGDERPDCPILDDLAGSA